MTVDMLDDNGKTFREPPRNHHTSSGKRHFFLVDLFLGFKFNPKLAGVDIKMMLYTWGAVILQLNLLSMWKKARIDNGGISTRASNVFTGLFTWFVVEYMYHEHVHLYTYDLFAEKIGFKLLWGMCFNKHLIDFAYESISLLST